MQVTVKTAAVPAIPTWVRRLGGAAAEVAMKEVFLFKLILSFVWKVYVVGGGSGFNETFGELWENEIDRVMFAFSPTRLFYHKQPTPLPSPCLREDGSLLPPRHSMHLQK